MRPGDKQSVIGAMQRVVKIDVAMSAAASATTVTDAAETDAMTACDAGTTGVEMNVEVLTSRRKRGRSALVLPEQIVSGC